MNRINLRYLSKHDEKCVYDLLKNPRVMKYIGPKRSLTDEESANWFNLELKNPSRFAIALKESNELIGFCGVKTIDGVLDFGYFLREKYWGQNYATEACTLALSNLKSKIDISNIEIFIASSNSASMGVARKLNWTRLFEVEKSGELGYLFFLDI